MSIDANKAIVRRYLERCVNGGDQAVADELVDQASSAKARSAAAASTRFRVFRYELRRWRDGVIQKMSAGSRVDL